MPADLSPIDQVLIAIRRLIRATDLHSKHLNKTAGLTSPQLLVLQAIRDQAEITIGEIARSVSLSQATVTTIVNRLESRGYVKRIKSVGGDRRKVFVALTDTGTELLVAAPTPLQERFVERFSQLQGWEQSMILSSLQRVAQMMDAERLDASPVLDVGDLARSEGAAVRAKGDGSASALDEVPDP